MPLLSSGINVYISVNHILEPDLNWFKAPEGHFWYTGSDEQCPPPYEPYGDQTFPYKHSPVPKDREEMKQYVQICFQRDDGMVYWVGDYLSDFPFFIKLDEQDLADWKAWLAEKEDDINEFLDEAIKRCATQAEIMKDAKGYVTMTSSTKKREDGWANAEKPIDNPLKDKQ